MSNTVLGMFMMIFRATLLLSMAATLSLSSAMAAAPSGVDRAFGNTIVSTYPDGRKGDLWLAPGGTYAAEGRRGDPSSGHWSVKDDKICLKQSKPIWAPFSFCTPLPSGDGSGWTAKAVTGEQISVKIETGHVSSHPQAKT